MKRLLENEGFKCEYLYIEGPKGVDAKKPTFISFAATEFVKSGKIQIIFIV